MQEEMITLYHLRDWYGNVNQERNNNHKSDIQQFVSLEATDFSVQRLHGFRQVVQHVQLHVAKWG
jgi:hypothetical protein